jgi:hypothetical protein
MDEYAERHWNVEWIACVNTDSDLLCESPSEDDEKALSYIYIYLFI